jgi:3'-phosphoadenosine 5'-phosphosulfate sulfotransferase (PAPS reductase)/FAD synthetase
MTALTSLSKDWKALSIELLNDLFMSMPFEKRIPMLYKYFEEQDVMVTSSFGTKSIFLLHLLHRFRPTQKVHFINTTYHFPGDTGLSKTDRKAFGKYDHRSLTRRKRKSTDQRGAMGGSTTPKCAVASIRWCRWNRSKHSIRCGSPA